MKGKQSEFLTIGNLKADIRSEESVEYPTGNFEHSISSLDFEKLMKERLPSIEGEMYEPLGKDSIRPLFER